MAIRPIVKFPDPVLAKPTKLVEKIDDEIKTLVADMIETMYNAPGVGLAANQVGVSLRVAVIDTEWSEDKPRNAYILINPEIISSDGEVHEEEGCLSFPGVNEQVKRYSKATVKFLDLDGNEQTLTGEGVLARAIQHECDHLDGKLYMDRLSTLKRGILKKRYAKLLKENK